MINHMDELSVQIELMDNLKLINFYYLYDRENSIPAVMVYYRADEVLNISSLDPHFERLMKRLFFLYREESFDNRIITDDATKAILEKGKFELETDLDVLLADFKETDTQAYYRKEYAYSTISQALSFILEILYKSHYDTFDISKLVKDWCGNGEMAITVDTKRERLHYRISSENSSYTKIIINDVLCANNLFTVEFFYEEEGLKITLHDIMLTISGEIIYSLHNSGMYEKIRISEGDNVLVSTERVIEGSTRNKETSIGLINHLFDKSDCYELRWGQKFIRSIEDGGIKTAFLSETDEFRYAYVICRKKVLLPRDTWFMFTDYSFSYYEPLIKQHYAVIRLEDRDKVYIERGKE